MNEVLQIGDTLYIANPYVNDYRLRRRSWKERLLSLPWKPWISKEWVYDPQGITMTMEDGPKHCLVSYQSYAQIEKELSRGHTLTPPVEGPPASEL